MHTRHAACLVRVCTLLALVLPVVPGQAAAAPPRQGTGGSVMVYHELTQRTDGSRPIEAPILSGDGRRAVWTESLWDPKQSKRVFALDIDGGQPREIDVYTPICRCHAQVDVSNDGNTVVSTEGVRIRRLSGGASLGRKNELIRLADNVISALRISGDGRTIVFAVLRDTTINEPNPRKRGTPIPRGVWAISADGGAPKQLVGIEDVAAAAGVPVAELEAYPDFRPDTWTHAYPLDVSDDGRRVIFGARAGTAGQGVFSISEGAPLTKLVGPVENVYQVAVSGDGQTVAFATVGQRGFNLSVSADGTLKTVPNFNFDFDLSDQRFGERLQLSRDGTKLLGKEKLGTVLVDVASLTKRRLIPLSLSLGARGESRLFNGGGTTYATMNAAGTRVLYVARPHGGDLVVIDLGATELGGAPLVRGFHVDPDTIPVDGSKSASVSAEISWEGTLLPVWLEIHLAGESDHSIGGETHVGSAELQDSVGPDPGRLQGVFADDLTHNTVRGGKPILGPRNLRLIIESQAADGRRHGTVFDADKTLTVGDPAASGGVYRGTGGGQTINIEVGEDRTPAQLVIGSVTAEIVLEATANGHAITGGSLSYDVQRVFDNGVEKESFTSSEGYGSLANYPGGAWGEVLFTGPITMQWENIEPQKYEVWDEGFDVALDKSGQLMLCPDTGDESDPQAAVSRCLATAIVVLRPVVEEPPSSP